MESKEEVRLTPPPPLLCIRVTLLGLCLLGLIMSLSIYSNYNVRYSLYVCPELCYVWIFFTIYIFTATPLKSFFCREPVKKLQL